MVETARPGDAMLHFSENNTTKNNKNFSTGRKHLQGEIGNCKNCGK